MGGGYASPAAQVAHVTFYLEVVERDLDGGGSEKSDWGKIWRTVEAVSPAVHSAYRLGEIRQALCVLSPGRG